ncbi:hypothetical protein FBY22_1929 [Streptomyces sp. SLBN-31]|nr:hypothetical protein FBY22_1929 [Streptomyces sp. SLBN-31]
MQVDGAVAAVGGREGEEFADQSAGEPAAAVLGADVDAAQLGGLAGGVTLGEPARVRRVGGAAGVQGGGGGDLAARGERHEQGVPLGGEVGGGRIDDVAVPSGHVAGAEVAVHGVEHHGSRTVEVVRARGPDAIIMHLHIICIKQSALIIAI